MICSHCVREVPDGSSCCPRCGGTLSPAENVSQPQAAAEIHALLDDGGGWEPAVPLQVARTGRGWEQTGRFTSRMVQEQEEQALPAYGVFSARGRLNRLKYLYLQIVSSFAMTIAYVALILILITNSPNKAILSLAVVPIYVLICVVQVFATVRRFHDIDEPGIHYLFLLIPFYNIYISLKLLFKSSVEERNEYGEKVNNHYYWQALLTLLLLPVIYFSIGLGVAGNSGLSAMLTRDLFEQKYYNDQYHVGITFPRGWIRTEPERALASAQSIIGTGAILLDAKRSDDIPSFDTLTREQLEQAGRTIADEHSLALDLHEADSLFTDVSDASSSVKDINGKMFVQVGFTAKYGGDDVRGITIFSVYGGRKIIVVICMPLNAAGRSLDTMMESADSLVVEDLTGE